jgi:hypothetical protein
MIPEPNFDINLLPPYEQAEFWYLAPMYNVRTMLPEQKERFAELFRMAIAAKQNAR